MVHLTDEAIHLVSDRLDRSPLAPGAGLRIWGTFVDNELVLTCGFVEGPTQADQVVDLKGARVFVDSEVAVHLDEKTISVEEEAGGVSLVIMSDWFGEDDFRLS